MYLTGTQLGDLATKIVEEADRPRLTEWARYVNEDLNNVAPGPNLWDSAYTLLNRLNSAAPPKVDQFLEVLSQRGNAKLRAAADELLRPSFFSPTSKAIDAIILGRTAFVARDELRASLSDFMNANPYTTRVLIVSGDEPGGKSYTWQFLRHLAQDIGANPVQLKLRGANYTPRQFFEQVYLLLGLDEKTLPELKDEPQLARIDPLLNAFKGKLKTLTTRHWLVIDDLNDPGVQKPVRETAYALAYAVEEMKPQNLWVALLGYNDPFDESELRHVARDDAEFPSKDMVAKHLDLIAASTLKPLPANRAGQIADAVFSRYAKLDKEAMIKITIEVEKLGENLKRGNHP